MPRPQPSSGSAPSTGGPRTAPTSAPVRPNEERADYSTVVLERRLRDALARLNPEQGTGDIRRLVMAIRWLGLPSG